ncbi:MAG: hypothetical protein Q9216_005178 [Gyalolechia sp. 2 TL-2023]
MALRFCLFSLSYTGFALALDVNATAGQSPPSAPKKLGWTPQPNGRGTLDIIWSCVVTMALCSWSITCLNMPGEKESKYVVLWRKFSLACLGILCPEIMTTTAIGQWVRARQLVRKFNLDDPEQEQVGTLDRQPTEAGEKSPSNEHHSKEIWTMEMAFFADMGGFRLCTKNKDPFPLDGKQLHFLIRKGLIKPPLFKPKMIDDKNKVDFLLRTIILCQILWFLVSTIGRWAQHLFVTTAEITTVSFILCSAVTFGFWWNKPADVVMAEYLYIDKDTDDLLKEEGKEGTPWDLTPLDFVSRDEWWWSKAFQSFMSMLNALHISFGSEGKPIDRIGDSLQRPLGQRELYGCLVMTTVCFSVFFIAWNHDFPTHVEMVLWRLTAVGFMSILYVTLLVSELIRIFKMADIRSKSWILRHSPSIPFQFERPSKSRFAIRDAKVVLSVARSISKALNKIRNNSPDGDPELYLPLRVILPLYIIAVLYCSCRTYILIADIIELRSLPASAFQSVSWQQFWPHLG